MSHTAINCDPLQTLLSWVQEVSWLGGRKLHEHTLAPLQQSEQVNYGCSFILVYLNRIKGKVIIRK